MHGGGGYSSSCGSILCSSSVVDKYIKLYFQVGSHGAPGLHVVPLVAEGYRPEGGIVPRSL